MSSFEMRIGLEVHCELKTRTKLLCSCRNSFGDEPGANCCPVCTGYPGALPSLNKSAVIMAVTAALALNCEPSEMCAWDRKNYFYPDLPKAWQTTQYFMPIAREGEFFFSSGGEKKSVGIARIQLEEDAGKLVHRGGVTTIDFNRCGVPLIEIVTRPSLSSPKEAADALSAIKTAMKYAGVSDVKMQEGSLRCDVNLSVKKSGAEWGERTEAKNLASIKAVEKYCEYEARRQISLLQSGAEVERCTMRWDDERQTASVMRRKESAPDYRYIGEPDIPPVIISKRLVERLKAAMPPTKEQRVARYTDEYSLPGYDAEILCQDKTVSDLFEAAVAAGMPPKSASNVIMTEILQLAKQPGSEDYSVRIGGKTLYDVWNMVKKGEISSVAAKRKLLPALWASDESAALLAEKLNIRRLDESQTYEAAEKVIAKNEKAVREYLNGSEKVFFYLVGQVMKVTEGNCDPDVVHRVIKEILNQNRRNTMKVYRTEYPNPQFERENWLSLNGKWEFEIDNARVGMGKKYWLRSSLDGEINVPFCPESKLSGVGNTDFMSVVWYKKTVTVPESMRGKRVFLHFGAVDWKSTVFINGEKVTEHVGGYVPFKTEVTSFGEKFDVTVCAEDPVYDDNYGHGKQCPVLESRGCDYTRTTGIWQSVWLEAVGERYIENFRVTPNVDACEIILEVEAKDAYGAEVQAVATYEGKKQGEVRFKIVDGSTTVHMSLDELHLWELGKGRLYDLQLNLIYNGKVTDSVKSYFGMRSVMFDGKKFLLNGKSVFGRFILDQGFYSDGIYTAPTTDRFEQDIRLSMDMGFNGARLHEKIFEPQALYYCDKMGYMVWEEYPNWGLDRASFDCVNKYLYEWMEAVKRDYNHPSIIGWCVLNEVWDAGRRRISDEAVKIAYYATKWYDKSRPVIDTSGGFHVVTDTFDVHDYEGDLDKFAAKYEKGQYITFDKIQKYEGQPYWISEYGGIKYIPFGDRDKGSWGYGNAAADEAEFLKRYCSITSSIMKNPETWALCYTQLYDVEQEVNGLYTYERKCKFSPEGVKAIHDCTAAKAAIED